MGKRVLISAFIATILVIVIRAILRNNGIHNFFSENSMGGFLIQSSIYVFLILFFKKRV
jgi:cytosine/uracil/thiamine/allantoin permease